MPSRPLPSPRGKFDTEKAKALGLAQKLEVAMAKQSELQAQLAARLQELKNAQGLAAQVDEAVRLISAKPPDGLQECEGPFELWRNAARPPLAKSGQGAGLALTALQEELARALGHALTCDAPACAIATCVCAAGHGCAHDQCVPRTP